MFRALVHAWATLRLRIARRMGEGAVLRGGAVAPEPRQTPTEPLDRLAATLSTPSEPDVLRQTVVEPPRHALPPPLPAEPPSTGRASSATPAKPLAGGTEIVEAGRALHSLPVALLYLYDDGQDSAEVFRVRQAPLVIGRKADVSIAHDPQIAERHAEIAWQRGGLSTVLTLRALEPEHPLFVRRHEAQLTPGAEFLAGGHRFRLASPDILEIGAAGQTPTACELSADTVVIGRDTPQLAESLAGDHALSSQHCALTRAGSGWTLRDVNSLNGVWIATVEVAVQSPIEFMLGEQRCRLVPPPALPVTGR